MATTGGANIAVDGLVFGYDTGYPLVSGSSDTYKFNRGEPTENIIAGTNLINVVAGTFTTDSTVDGVRILENDQVNNSHVMWNSATGFIVTCSAGAYITVSAEYKTDCTIRMRFRDNPYDTQYDIDGGNIATISSQDVDINTNGEWKRYSLTAQTSTANPDLWWYLVDYRNNNEFGRVEIRNWQIEVKSHATPFTTGTRSASGSLIDLTRTTDIDLSNVSFDSNAQMTFDGTDDIINLDTIAFDIGDWTFEAVSNSNTELQSIITGGKFQAGLGYFNLYTSGMLLENSTNTAALSTAHLDGNYHHLVGTVDRSASTIRFYVDGELVATNTTWNGTTTTNLSVGIGANRRPNSTTNRFYNGNIPVAKIYNRALTAQEVQQNYNALKERFSL